MISLGMMIERFSDSGVQSCCTRDPPANGGQRPIPQVDAAHESNSGELAEEKSPCAVRRERLAASRLYNRFPSRGAPSLAAGFPPTRFSAGASDMHNCESVHATLNNLAELCRESSLP
jgi:hypothetical protein